MAVDDKIQHGHDFGPVDQNTNEQTIEERNFDLELSDHLRDLSLPSGSLVLMILEHHTDWFKLEKVVQQFECLSCCFGTNREPKDLEQHLKSLEPSVIILSNQLALKRFEVLINSISQSSVLLFVDLSLPEIDRELGSKNDLTNSNLAGNSKSSEARWLEIDFVRQDSMPVVMRSQHNLQVQLDNLCLLLPKKRGLRILNLLPIGSEAAKAFKQLESKFEWKQIFLTVSKKQSILEMLRREEPDLLLADQDTWLDLVNEIFAKRSEASESNNRKTGFFQKLKLAHKRAIYRLLGSRRLGSPVRDPLAILGGLFCTFALLPLRMLAELFVFSSLKKHVGVTVKMGICFSPLDTQADLSALALIDLKTLKIFGRSELGPLVSYGQNNFGKLGDRGFLAKGLDYSHSEDQGSLLLRSEQIMQGYYKKPLKTRELIDTQHWFDTGLRLSVDKERRIRETKQPSKPHTID